jgi:hypothetical protein
MATNDICITLSNVGGGAPVTFVVTDPRDLTTTMVILGPADPPVDVCLLDWPCGEFIIPVTADDVPDDQTVTVDCGETPEIDVGITCDVDGDAIVEICAMTIDCPSEITVIDPYLMVPVVIACVPGVESCATITLPCGQEWTIEIYDCFGEQINQVLVECTCEDPCPTVLDIQGFSRV